MADIPFNDANNALTADPAAGSLPGIMDTKADGFNVEVVTTSDVTGGMPGVPTMVPLTSNEGTILAEHHNLVVLSDQAPQQDFAGLRDKGAQ